MSVETSRYSVTGLACSRRADARASVGHRLLTEGDTHVPRQTVRGDHSNPREDRHTREVPQLTARAATLGVPLNAGPTGRDKGEVPPGQWGCDREDQDTGRGRVAVRVGWH